MPRVYTSTGITTVGATPPTSIIGLTSVTTVRPTVIEVAWGAFTAPGDFALRMAVKRTTTTGTATATTPKANDFDDPASLLGSASRSAFTAEPTKTDTLYDIGIHQRSTYRWQTTNARAWILPAIANYGLVLECTSISSGTPSIAGTIVHEE